MKRPRLRTAAISLILGTVAAAGLSFYVPIPARRLDPRPVRSLRIEDRNGLLLREILSEEGGRCRWIGLPEVPPVLLKAVLAAEDAHYLTHPGINPYAVIRAFVQNLRRGRVVSGASTITQQVVRNLYHFRRTFLSKAAEAWLAVRLEHTLSKDEILVQYLNRISYGNGTFGIEAAARQYFDKPARDLSPAEAAYLTAIPKAPSELNPYRNPAAVRERQREILDLMAGRGWLGRDDAERARTEPVRVLPASAKFRAPHFCDYVLASIPSEARRTMSVLRTTLDLAVQEKTEALVRGHLAGMEKRGLTNAAVLILDNASGDILSMVGSRDFFDERAGGQVNAALALRQPGSALKPLTYALAVEKGLTAATILDDVPTQFPTLDGSFAPDNYDGRYHGPIRLRSALASSYNIPAAAVLDALGPDLLYRKLRDLAFTSLDRPPSFYGVGLTLGNGEVRLLELASAYASLARGGLFLTTRSLLAAGGEDGRLIAAAAPPPPRRVFREDAAYVITHILADRDARVPTFGYASALDLPFPAAVKTGTSKDFRDNWTIGYTPTHTVGVWAGNFDGSPMHSVSGITGAGPLFHDVMLLLNPDPGAARSFSVPSSIVRLRICPDSGELPSDRCPSSIEEIFIRGSEPKSVCRSAHGASPRRTLPAAAGPFRANGAFVVRFPRDGDVFKIDPILRREAQTIVFRAGVPEGLDVKAVEWWVNGRRLERREAPFTMSWKLSPGSYTIRARAVLTTGERDSPAIRITVIS
jgi:penicillin-binding protein 1C